MSERDEIHPPRVVERILRLLLGSGADGSSIIGDLHQEFLGRAERGLWRARLWYTYQALGIALGYATRSMRRERRRGRLDGGGQWSWAGFVDTLMFNLRYAIRRLRQSPVFTLVAILSLGLGIGANTAMFSLVNAIVLRDQPFEDPETLVNVYESASGASLSYPNYEDLAEGSTDVFAGLSGTMMTFLQADVEDGVEMLVGEAVTGNYFSLTGVQPALGRLLGDEDHVAPGAHPVVVLGHGYWGRRYGNDPSVVGSEMRLGGRQYTIIGVAPEEYTGIFRGVVTDAYVPIMMYDELLGGGFRQLESRGRHNLLAMARLLPGVTMVQAKAVAGRVENDLREEYPRAWPPERSFTLVSTADLILIPAIDRLLVPAAAMLMIVVGLVLLIACANLASFLLARAADRRKEIAVRLAMGARRRTLVGQLLTETVLLSTLGGIAGVALAVLSLNALLAADLPLPNDMRITFDLSLDTTVLTFSVLVSVGAGLLFGLAPALQSTNPDLALTLRDETAGGGRARGAALRNLLVMGQVSASVVLLVGAGLFLRSLDASRNIDPGFGYAPTGILEINVQADRYSEEETQIYLNTLQERIAQIPGVQSVGYTTHLPLALGTTILRLEVDGIDPPPDATDHRVDGSRINDEFLAAAGIELLAGRGFDATDVVNGEPVALVNEELVRRFFPQGDAVGRTVRINDAETQIVGVTGDTKVRRIGEVQRPYVFLNHRQNFRPAVTILASTSGNADALALEMLSAARALDPEIMIFNSQTMERHLSLMIVAREWGALVVVGFAFLALFLASIGLYGVVSYAVSRRTREVGIRLSLGARTSSVVWMLTGGGMKLVGSGLLVGLIAAAALSQLLSRLLYGVPALDPLTFVGVPVVLGVVALAASWIPARRVTRISPVGALRSE